MASEREQRRSFRARGWGRKKKKKENMFEAVVDAILEVRAAHDLCVLWPIPKNFFNPRALK